MAGKLSSDSAVVLIAICIVAGLLIIFSCSLFWQWAERRKRRQEQGPWRDHMGPCPMTERDLPAFTNFNEIALAALHAASPPPPPLLLQQQQQQQHLQLQLQQQQSLQKSVAPLPPLSNSPSSGSQSYKPVRYLQTATIGTPLGTVIKPTPAVQTHSYAR
eukprot:Rhum_TRINITY_DN11756_c0_g1::Rhum_TRINITY_DN11756_c0_g1_i1::g.46652::m.46652